MIKEKLLRFLIENRELDFSINEISKKTKTDYKLTHMNILRLEKEDLIKIKNLGNSKRCSFKNKFNSTTYEVEEERTKDIIKNPNLDILKDKIDNIEDPFFTILLFGSYAKKKNIKTSDIDLCIISDNKETRIELAKRLRILPLKIHLIEFDRKEFISMLRAKENNVGKEILKNNIILHGIEAFYGMINHV